MRILQVSNLVSHHQLPLARKLSQLVGPENFRFCATQAPDNERARLGWSSNDDAPWILRAGECPADRLLFEQWWDKADVILCGERLFERMKDRLVQNKLCFYMSERWWKPPIGIGRMLSPQFLRMAMKFRQIASNPEFHYLPVGPFAEYDISYISNLSGRMWRWGYFTDTPYLSPPVPVRGKKLKVLWVGRMIGLKRVDTLIKALSALSRISDSFELTLVGDGSERIRLEKLAAQLLDPQRYVFLDFVPANKVAEIMAQHHVYVFPSTAYEGWGAVLNEAMACGCAVVASKSTGSAAALIEDGINGLLFTPGDWRELARCLNRLTESDELRKKIAKTGQSYVNDVWSPYAAANRFVAVNEALLTKSKLPIYEGGPMSRSILAA